MSVRWGRQAGTLRAGCRPASCSLPRKLPLRVPTILLTLLALVLAGAFLTPEPARADPSYPGPLLYGLDPVIRTTDDPRLLGVDRILLRDRLEKLGVDPVRDAGRLPSAYTSMRRAWRAKSRVDLVRIEEVVEYNGTLGVMTRFRYPSYFFLFPARQVLAGGFVYYPPRPVDDPVVDLFLDDLQAGQRRSRAADRRRVWAKSLNIYGSGGAAGGSTDLLNLTIPIKLPRTLEKIIGRGEKTRIKISGREHISIGGESTVVKPFIASERVQSQSYFPSLDMNQQLQVNLSGSIGEKILIEVSHDSEAIGPDGTQIKLMYRGLEDEIIKTIEAGDVGLTLPNSQLLGYSSNKSGLFGVKVTGQVGRADFTVVASKQKSESSAKTFNSSGGTLEDYTIYSYNYVKNRFFFLDLPTDAPGVPSGFEIDPESIYVYRMMGGATQQDGDVINVAVYVDDTGVFWSQNVSGVPASDFDNPYFSSQRWREVTIEKVRDTYGNLVAIDTRQQMLDEDMLAVVYRLKDSSGNVIRVGDKPGLDSRSQDLGDDLAYYKMKLLKAPAADSEPYTFDYALRNIYSLGGSRIDAETFELRIERNDQSLTHPELETQSQLPWVQIFGLDQGDGRGGPPDGLVDTDDIYVFDLEEGLLKFPLDFPQPFAADSTKYVGYAGDEFVFEGSDLDKSGVLTPEIYSVTTLPSEYDTYGTFKIIASHASAASSFSLGASNIEEGSETVTVDGRTLQRDTDYEIDYTFGQITLKGDNAILTPDSKVSVTFSYAPFVGGGKTSLLGFNLGYDIGRESKFSTTWLYQSTAIVGEKAKLGEEPNRMVVGNINFQHTFKPYFLTHVANFFSRRDSERESRVQLSGEVAVSLPNPNTMDQVYLEDFEGVDASDIISLTRTSWFWASAPVDLVDGSLVDYYDPADRVPAVRWFLDKDRVLRRYLNPDLEGQERDETQQAMDLFLWADPDSGWGDQNWGGIMRGVSRTGLDISRSQFLEFWVNDKVVDPERRGGRLHIDFGRISEDGFWPKQSDGSLLVGEWEHEDGINSEAERDWVWTQAEDIGLDGNERGPQLYDAAYDYEGTSTLPTGETVTPDYPGPNTPYPGINGTARNNREDTEDLNGNTRLDTENTYFSVVVSLADSALIDVLRDYPASDTDELAANSIAWRKYRIRLSDAIEVAEDPGDVPSLEAVTHVRIWYEWSDEDAFVPRRDQIHLQLSDLRFLGSRWRREGVRYRTDERLLSEAERLPTEEFYLGEANNKENPDYQNDPPPFEVPVLNGIEEKEQSILLDLRDLKFDHLVRAGKQVSPRGDDYTKYRDMSWYWYNALDSNADLDLFFRVGSDTLNFYEVSYRFSDSAARTGWKPIKIDMAELANVKTQLADSAGVIHSTIQDVDSGDAYRVRVVGQPDLREVKKYFFGVVNDRIYPAASGYIYLNDVKLEGVKRDMGLARRAGINVNMADVLKLSFDWQLKDAEFHGLDSDVGTGVDYESWNFSTNFSVDDYIPLLGFQLPVQLSKNKITNRPKYYTNSDIEIFDAAVKDSLSTITTQETFSTRLRHAPSKAALLRYLIDPWQLTVSGNRQYKTSPLERSGTKSLQGALNYDLRIPARATLGGLPLIEHVPFVRDISVMPEKIEGAASFTNTYSAKTTIDLDGTESERPATRRRPGKLHGGMDYKPHPLLTLNVGADSERDLLVENRSMGVNLGQELNRKYTTRATFLMPKPKDVSSSPIMYPVRLAVRGLNELRPSLQFTGSYNDVTNPAQFEDNDPVGIHNMSNDGSWDLRFSFPLGDAVKKVAPEKKYSQSDRNRIIEEERRRQSQESRRQGRGEEETTSDSTTTTTTESTLDDETLTPEERQRREEERLLEEAERRMQEERERQGGRPGEPAGGPGGFRGPGRSADVTQQGDGAVEGEQGGGPPFSVPNPLSIVMNTLRNTNPVKVTVSQRRSSAYGRTTGKATFWYLAGLEQGLDIPDSLVNVYSATERKSLSASTSTKVTTTLSLDVKYSTERAETDRLGSVSSDYKQDWPDAQLSLSGMEKWRLFGGKAGRPEDNWLRSSNASISYKHSKTVSGMTETSYNPRTSTTINPRWTVNFQNGLTATVTSSLANELTVTNGTLSETDRVRYGLQLKHQFRAQRLLAKIGLYRPGANPSITMDVDISYLQNQTVRTNPGAEPSAATGTRQYGVTPRFTYQITRNLTSGLNMGFNRTVNLATEQSSTRISLGMEVTFVF